MQNKEKEWEKLCELFASVKNKETMEQLFNLFLTPSERGFLKDRYKIVQAILNSSLSQREIAKEAEVSIAKITAGSNELKKTPDSLKQLLTRFFAGD